MTQKQKEEPEQIKSDPIVVPETKGIIDKLDNAIQKHKDDYEDIYVCAICEDRDCPCEPKIWVRVLK